MAVAIRGSATTNSGLSSTASSDYVSGLQAGDLMIMSVASNAGATPSASGWTKPIDQNNAGINHLTVFYKLATGSESGSQSITMGSSVEWVTGMVAFSGADQTTPVGASNSSVNTINDNRVNCSAGITPAAANSMLVIIGGTDTTVTASGYQITTSNPTWTEVVDNGLPGRGIHIAYGLRAAATATGAAEFTISSSRKHIGSILSVTESTVVGPTTVKTKDGVTQSTGVKTYEGVATASVKSVVGAT